MLIATCIFKLCHQYLIYSLENISFCNKKHTTQKYAHIYMYVTTIYIFTACFEKFIYTINACMHFNKIIIPRFGSSVPYCR